MIKATYGVLARVFAIILIVVGTAAIFGGTYAHGFATEQLKQERITMPTQEGIDKLEDQASKEILQQWVGQDLTTGPQAKACADNYIWQHMMASSGGKTFQEFGTVITQAKRMENRPMGLQHFKRGTIASFEVLPSAAFF